ncbi:MAG: hypothetical protein ABR881_11865 [Candidatus Sulfotelmatobacter sp.]|jgi:hypothetical protein
MAIFFRQSERWDQYRLIKAFQGFISKLPLDQHEHRENDYDRGGLRGTGNRAQESTEVRDKISMEVRLPGLERDEQAARRRPLHSQHVQLFVQGL